MQWWGAGLNRLVRAWLDKEIETPEGCAAYQQFQLGSFLGLSATLLAYEAMEHCKPQAFKFILKVGYCRHTWLSTIGERGICFLLRHLN